MPFYPGPGLGGHCIPIDPFYLSWKARQSGFEARFIELAGHVNGAMPEYVVERVAEALNSTRRALNGSRVHVFGIAYKRDVNDMRESPALDVLELMQRRGALVSYTDPYVPELRHGNLDLHSIAEAESADGADCAVIITDHKAFDYARIVEKFPLIVDTRNALKGNGSTKIFRL
jgi:UDP-N-acetyl-D-glucosamine dehydrogenase